MHKFWLSLQSILLVPTQSACVHESLRCMRPRAVAWL